MRKTRTGGFTLIEVMISTGISALVMAGLLVMFHQTGRFSRAAAYQVFFNSKARSVSQRVIRLIEQAKAVGISSNSVEIITVDLVRSRIEFDTGDGDETTVQDNVLRYTPNLANPNQSIVLANYIRPIPGEEMFDILPLSPDAVAIRFHIGDGTNVLDASFSGTGHGYQGTEVRLSATPRNIQRWYD